MTPKTTPLSHLTSREFMALYSSQTITHHSVRLIDRELDRRVSTPADKEGTAS